jgi:Ca-activated chloride channel homolog
METSALTFAHPAWLNLLWLLPPVILLFWWAEQRRRALIGRIVAPKLRSLLAGNTSPARRWFRNACVLGALGLLAVALAGPRLGYDTLEVPHKGRDVLIAMDVSRSMLATDVAPTRLQRAKLLVEDLVSELGGDRLGLVAFAGSAFLQAPLTLDHGAVLAAVDELDTDLIPKGGSNLAAAIRTCEEAFGKAEGFSRAIVIVSDGEELDADGLEAARQAAANGIRIFTVGVGSKEGSEIPLGPGEFVRDASGKIVQSRLDASRMTEIAEITGGFYVPLDEDAARRLVSEGIGQMKEVEMTASASRRPIERYQWPLGAAIGLLVLQALVGERRRRPLAVAACWFLAASSGWAAPAGLSAYEKGDYEAARSAFEQRLQMEPDAPDLQLNAGTAAYRLKDYGKASEYFSRAMLAEDPAVRSAAEFNLGNTLFRQGEGQGDKEKKITDWKDAIAKYDAALKTRPDYTEAKENKERVEELLKQAEQEQKQDKKKDQKKDQQQQGGQQQKQDQQQGGGDQKKEDQQQGGGDQKKEDQQQGGQQNKDQQQQGGGGQKDQQQKDQQNKDQQQGGGGQKDQEQQQKDQQKKDEQQQGGGEKKEDQQQGGQQQKKQQPSADGGEKEQEQSGQQKKDEQQQGGGGQQEQQQQEGEGKKEEGEQGQQKDQQQGQGSGGEKEQDKEGEQKKDEQQQGGGGQKQDEQQKDGEGREGEEKKEGGKKPGEQQQQGGEGGEEQKDQQQADRAGSSPGARPEPGKAGDKPAPVPQQAGDKKQGELRGGSAEGGGEKKEGAVGVAASEEEVDGKMSAAQARALLRSLQSEEEQVELRERQNFQDVIRDW